MMTEEIAAQVAKVRQEVTKLLGMLDKIQPPAAKVKTTARK